MQIELNWDKGCSSADEGLWKATYYTNMQLPQYVTLGVSVAFKKPWLKVKSVLPYYSGTYTVSLAFSYHVL